ncbi:uracil-DNA glycosylase [Schlesneria paludicola]|uniref:uracil-DNA glycosylase n=1 Tax=Schlesneria paludicola TaxID=360056 RepID=UPI00029AA8CE|nr:uracil-DNA glycosylase [Schlesneria paludicola]
MPGVDENSERIRNAVIQRLEDLRRAGVTHWKQIQPAAPVVIAAAPVAHPASVAVAAVSTPPKTATPVASAPRTNLLGETERSQVPPRKVSPPVTPAAPAVPFQPLNLPLAERIAGLAALQARVKDCTRCHELATTRTQTVFGVGNPEAKIMFVGEAPGADEDAQGEPFVGRSGQLLNDIIKACRMRREEIYICNVLRCRPPSNRLPTPVEAGHCREYLDGQIAHVNPEYIVCWGACAAQNLLAVTEPIGKLRGRFHSYGRAKVLCTYHPSYLMRNPAAKKDVWEDMKTLFLDMGIDLSAKSK